MCCCTLSSCLLGRHWCRQIECELLLTIAHGGRGEPSVSGSSHNRDLRDSSICAQFVDMEHGELINELIIQILFVCWLLQVIREVIVERIGIRQRCLVDNYYWSSFEFWNLVHNWLFLPLNLFS